VNAAVARTTVGEALLAAAEAAGALVIERDITVDDMSDYQPHQVRKKHTAALRHEAIAEAGRIRPQTARLRIDELAANVPVDVRTNQIEGTRRRIAIGKASQPTPR
jgi:coenzyme F420 hydrogenase subunit beta